MCGVDGARCVCRKDGEVPEVAVGIVVGVDVAFCVCGSPAEVGPCIVEEEG